MKVNNLVFKNDDWGNQNEIAGSGNCEVVLIKTAGSTAVDGFQVNLELFERNHTDREHNEVYFLQHSKSRRLDSIENRWVNLFRTQL